MVQSAGSKYPYQDHFLPITERVEDLLNRMSLVEKIAQLGSAWFTEISDEASSEAGILSVRKAKSRIGNGLGSLTRPGGSTSFTPQETARANNALQDFLRKQTRLGIPALVHEECLSGLMARSATVFPQIIGLASSWNPDLIESIGRTISNQIRATGAHHGLAPVLDITRDPRWGRVEETFGEDRYLTARLGTAYVRGIQGDGKTGVFATGKHFAAHGMPEGGLNWAPVYMGERELREIHLHTFEAAVKEAGLGTVMITYHELDGVPVAASRWLIDQVLRKEWGFQGIVISDYNAILMLVDYHHTARDKQDAAMQALSAGVDLELPQTDCYGNPLINALENGVLELRILDEAVRRILTLKFRLGLFEDPFVSEEEVAAYFNREEDQQLALEAARQSIVLLKNEGNLLPLSKQIHSVAVIGPNAMTKRRLLGDYSYASFAELMSGGATDPVIGGHQDSQPRQFPESIPLDMKTIYDGIREKVSSTTKVKYAPGCGFNDQSKEGFEEAISLARDAELIILLMGGKSGLTQDCTTGELRDSSSLELPGVQEELIEELIALEKPVILVLVGGRPAAIPDKVGRIPAVLNVWLPGEKGAEAVAEVLFGDLNPSGKLPITFPRSVGQVPVYYSHKPSGGQSYNFIDYVNQSSKPLFPFGHGLSYTQFEYSDLQIESAIKSVQNSGGNKSALIFPVETTLLVSACVTNTGKYRGAEVVQLYVRDLVSSISRPVMELKGFIRLDLEPDEKRSVYFEIPSSLFAFYDLNMEYTIEPGEFEIMVGSSSQDIRLSQTFELSGSAPATVEKKEFFSKSWIL